MESRPYQDELVELSLQDLRRGLSPMVCAITGSGKTEMAFRIIREGGFRRVLFLVPGAVLLSQTSDRARSYGINASCKWPSKSEWRHDVRIMVVTPTSAYNRMKQGLLDGFEAPDLVIIDEAHHCYTSADSRDKPGRSSMLVEYLKGQGSKVVGLSATVWRMSDYQGFDELFDTIHHSPTLKEMALDGYLAPLHLITPATANNRVHGGAVQSGEYTARGIEMKNDSSIYTERAVEILKIQQAPLEPYQWKQTIVYAISIGHAIRLANILAENGVPTGFVSSRPPNEDEGGLDPSVETDRDEAVERFKTGELRVVVNYAIVTEGFDLASAEIVLITRPTKSKALYRQMCGRATRKMKGKDYGLIIDCTDNWETFGGPMSPDFYYLQPRDKDRVAGEKTMEIFCCARPVEGKGDTIGVCASIIPNARTRVCPTCEREQGELCSRCNTFRRYDNMNWVDGRLVCVHCVREEHQMKKLKEYLEQQERDRLEHPITNPDLLELYKSMKETRNGGENDRWRSLKELGLSPPMVGSYGIKEKAGRWKPWFRYGDNTWKLGGAWYDSADEAMQKLDDTVRKEVYKHALGNAITVTEVSTSEHRKTPTW